MRIDRFAIVSGLGWLIDMGLMTAGVALGASVFWANMLGASVAVSFVFAVAQRRIFVHDGTVLGRNFALYCGWQALAVPAASVLIHALAALLARWGAGGMLLVFAGWFMPDPWMAPFAGQTHVIESILAKAFVTPLTLYANFIFMGWLLERRVSWL